MEQRACALDGIEILAQGNEMLAGLDAKFFRAILFAVSEDYEVPERQAINCFIFLKKKPLKAQDLK